MIEIRELAKNICDSMAGALKRYSEISGHFEEEMPEHFAVSYLMLDLAGPTGKIADPISMIMELNGTKLLNRNMRKRGDFDKDASSYQKKDAAQDIGNARKKCDLVIFEGGPAESDNQYLFCIVEIKKGYLSVDDVNKITAWHSELENCPYGIVASYCETPRLDSYISHRENEAKKNGHNWVIHRASEISIGKIQKKYVTFAEYWENPHFSTQNSPKR